MRGRIPPLFRFNVVVRGQNDTAHEQLARIAGAAHGVVTRSEALRAGVTIGQVEWRVRTGALLSAFPGVYRVGHRAPSREAHYVAAVKACGEGAVLCGRAAAHLLGLLKGDAPPPEVLTPRRRRVNGMRTRYSRRIDPRDVTELRRIPVTTVPRTVVDLARDLPPFPARPSLSRGRGRFGTKPKHVEAVLARRPNGPGAKNLRQVMYGDEPVTLSELESAFLSAMRQAGLPLPRTNRSAGAHYADVFEDQRVMLSELRQLLARR